MKTYIQFNTIIISVEAENNDLSKLKITKLENDYLHHSRFYIVPEDGIIDGREVHAGDVVMTIYGDTNNEDRYVIFPSTDQFTQYFVKQVEEDKKRRDLPDADGPCCGNAA